MKRFSDTWLSAHRVIPVGTIVFCLCAFWLTTRFDRVPPILKRGIQPSDFPQLVIGVIVSLCLVLIFTDQSKAPGKLNPMVWNTLGLLGSFTLIAHIDLFLALGVFACALTFLWGERKIMVLGALGGILPVAVFFLFDLVFKIRFPRGLLTNIWYG